MMWALGALLICARPSFSQVGATAGTSMNSTEE
jgi:hypothetical protein